LQTGGSAAGDTSTKSRDLSSASLRASLIWRIPSCSPFSPITLTCLALISLFTLTSFEMMPPPKSYKYKKRIIKNPLQKYNTKICKNTNLNKSNI
jgi:hypothetical protein